MLTAGQPFTIQRSLAGKQGTYRRIYRSFPSASGRLLLHCEQKADNLQTHEAICQHRKPSLKQREKRNPEDTETMQKILKEISYNTLSETEDSASVKQESKNDSQGKNFRTNA